MTEGLLLSREEIVRSHDYVRPHVEAGYRLHGGYVATGEYRSPRTLVRGPAVERWAEALVGNGGELIDVSRSILPTPTWPNLQQSRLLMEKGLDRTLWNLLTATGIVEARGGIGAAVLLFLLRGRRREEGRRIHRLRLAARKELRPTRT